MSTATATATKEAKTASDADLKALLGQDAHPLADVMAALGANADALLARAWAAGDVEFGRRNHCVSGQLGTPNSILRVEEGWDWSGPKTKGHDHFKAIRANKVPQTHKCLKYVRQMKTGKNPNTGLDVWEDVPADNPDAANGLEVRWEPRGIEHSEAHKLVALYVRLTDKALGAIAV